MTTQPLRTIVIGGPVYRMQVRAEHATMLADFTLCAAMEGRRIAFRYGHTSSLPLGRTQALAAAMDVGADALLSIDADMWIDTEVLMRALLAAERAFAAPDVAAMGIVASEDVGTSNAILELGADRERRAAPFGPSSPLPRWSPFAVHAIGAGATIHNLRWHRAQRDRDLNDKASPVWPWGAYAMLVTPVDGRRSEYWGEDEWFCRRVREVGGRVLALYTAGGVHHASFSTDVAAGSVW